MMRGILSFMMLVQCAHCMAAEDISTLDFSQMVHDRLLAKETDVAVSLVRKRIAESGDLTSRSFLSVLRSLSADDVTGKELIDLAVERLAHRPGLVARVVGEWALKIYRNESLAQVREVDYSRSHELFERCHELLKEDWSSSMVDEVALWAEIGRSYLRVGDGHQARVAFARVVFRHPSTPPVGITNSYQRSRFEHAYELSLRGYLEASRDEVFWLEGILDRSVEMDEYIPMVEEAIVEYEQRSGLSDDQRLSRRRNRLITLARMGHPQSIEALEDYVAGDRQVQGVLWSHVDVDRPFSSSTSRHSGLAAKVLVRNGVEELAEQVYQGLTSDDPDRVDWSINNLASLHTPLALEELFELIGDSAERPPHIVALDATTPDEEGIHLEEPRLPVGLTVMQALSRSVKDPPFGSEVAPSWDQLDKWRLWYERYLSTYE